MYWEHAETSSYVSSWHAEASSYCAINATYRSLMDCYLPQPAQRSAGQRRPTATERLSLSLRHDSKGRSRAPWTRARCGIRCHPQIRATRSSGPQPTPFQMCGMKRATERMRIHKIRGVRTLPCLKNTPNTWPSLNEVTFKQYFQKIK